MRSGRHDVMTKGGQEMQALKCNYFRGKTTLFEKKYCMFKKNVVTLRRI